MDDPNRFLQATPGRMQVPPAQQQQQPNDAANGAAQDLTYIWGTGIAIETFKLQFQEFLESFTTPQSAPHPVYLRTLHRMRLRESRDLEVDFTSLKQHRPELFGQCVANPAECLHLMSAVAEQVFRTLFPEVADEYGVNVVAKNLPSIIPLRELSPQHLESLVAVKGMVVRTSKVIPEVRVAFFRCWACQFSERSVVERGRIFEPVRCGHCGKQYSYQLIHNLSVFEDKQLIRLQEAPEHLADGETPVTISVAVYGELVDAVVPGDRLVVTGVYRSAPLKLNANTRIVRSVFGTHLDGIHFEKLTRATAGILGADEELDMTNAPRLDMFHRIARRSDVYDILLRSFAGSIWGHDDVKRGILAQMFGGTRKTFAHGKYRAELNIILCGDPGVAKSQLLTHVHSVSPRGVYTSGKGSSSVGLTAFVVKDADTGEFVLEPGALVLSDRGICCIDEFDKMNEATRSVLHEVMEQQTLSIAKAGIIAQLNARTSVLAAANPKDSQWNPTLNIVENLQIEPTLLSRFDLIFLVLDRHDEALDRQLASHVLALYADKRLTEAEDIAAAAHALASNVLVHNGEVFLTGPATAPVMPQKILSQYIAYAKERIHPALTETAHKRLAEAYVELRKVRGSGKTVSATLRQLESMIRLSEARAKMRFSEFVQVDDVTEAKRLISSALKEAATDPRTGLINLDMFAAADPTRNTVESCIQKLERIIEKKFIPLGKKTATIHELRVALNESMPGTKPLPPFQFTEMLAMMSGGDFVASFTATAVTFAAGGGGDR